MVRAADVEAFRESEVRAVTSRLAVVSGPAVMTVSAPVPAGEAAVPGEGAAVRAVRVGDVAVSAPTGDVAVFVCVMGAAVFVSAGEAAASVSVAGTVVSVSAGEAAASVSVVGTLVSVSAGEAVVFVCVAGTAVSTSAGEAGVSVSAGKPVVFMPTGKASVSMSVAEAAVVRTAAVSLAVGVIGPMIAAPAFVELGVGAEADVGTVHAALAEPAAAEAASRSALPQLLHQAATATHLAQPVRAAELLHDCGESVGDGGQLLRGEC